MNAWLGELDLAAWQAFLASLPQDVRALWADADLETLVGEWASGGMDGAPDALLRQLGGLLLGQGARLGRAAAHAAGARVPHGAGAGAHGRARGRRAGRGGLCLPLLFALGRARRVAFAGNARALVQWIRSAAFMELALPGADAAAHRGGRRRVPRACFQPP